VFNCDRPPQSSLGGHSRGMERSRSTHRQRRTSALRRTLRRQGVLSQEGGARAPALTINSLTSAFQAIGIDLSGSSFTFLNDLDWHTKPEAARNYTTLIEKQDELLSLALAHVKRILDITDKTTETEIMTKITNTTSAKDLIKVFNVFFNLLCLTNFDKLDSEDGCDKSRYSKVYYNLNRKNIRLYSTVKQGQATQVSEPVDRYNLATILLHPNLLSNISIKSVSNILNVLSSDNATQTLIGTEGEKDTLSFVFLVEKYTSYIFSTAYSLISDKPRDALYPWGCAELSEEFWYNFFISFLRNVKEDTKAYTRQKVGVDSGATKQSDKSSFTETITADAFGEITAVVYNNRASKRDEILTKFTADAFAPPAQPSAGVSTRGTGALAQPRLTRDDMTGMLPANTWGQELAPGVTFQKLLYRLSVPEVHYLLHLIGSLKELQTETPPATSA
jgi:hypothetical protein